MVRPACAFAVLAACLLLGSPRVAHAQRARIAGAPRLDVTIGGGLVTGVSIGEADASLRANATAPQAYRLFSTDTRVRRAPVADLRFAGVITGRLAAEGQLIVGQSELQTAITNDVESAPSVTVSERLTQVMLGGGIRVRLGHVSRPGRTMPYVSGGAGLLRQVHEGRIATERSPVFYLGGGLRRALGSGPIGSSRMGVRADAQLLMVRGGLRLDDTIASRISAMGGVFFSF